MAIQDRNLTAGTKLYARYKGQTHTAEVAEKEGKLVYQLPDGREFKSPSAAGTGITGLACNGWTFWSVGEPGEATGPITSTRARPPASSKVHPVPKPEAKRRTRKTQAGEPPAGDEPRDDQDGDRLRDDAPTAAEPDQQPVRCAECGETFPTTEAATEHYYAAHGKPEGEPTA